jgi:hypothetical protein
VSAPIPPSAPTTPGRSESPPSAPGSLTAGPSAIEARAYLDALGHWCSALRDALGALDANAQLAHDPGAYTHDIVLAMSLWHSIDARREEMVTVWDSGRVGPDQLATIATLIWGRLADPLGAPSAFNLPEACTLAAALHDRLVSVLAGEAIAGSGAAARIAPLRASLERCRHQAGALRIPSTRIDELAAELEDAIAGSDPTVIAATVERVDEETAVLERDLIKAASLRSDVAFQEVELRRRYDDLTKLEGVVEELGRRCNAKIANAPRLGIPSVAALGAPPAPVMGTNVSEWDAARLELARYAEKIGRCAAALGTAQERFAAPLREREDLRGLLGAYRDRAASNGLAEDAALEDRYRSARDMLWSAPCDLTTARSLVAEYQHAVRVAVGADTVPEPTRTDSSPKPTSPKPTARAKERS